MNIKEFLKSSFSFSDGFHAICYKVRFWRNNPDYFDPDGIWVFCGPQGSGKTLSAVKCLLEIHKRYPKAMIVSNMHINGVEYTPFSDYEQIVTLTNGVNGIIFFLDEMHVLWNSLESKNVPISEMAVFCQMRKDRRVIIGTSQVWGRVAKPIREQVKYCIKCQNFFGIYQHNLILSPQEGEEKDGKLSAAVIGKQHFFHTAALYQSYDTLNKIERARRKSK